MRPHKRSQLDDMRSQLKSAPASLHSNYFRDLHEPSKENARNSKHTGAWISKARHISRPKLQAYRAMTDPPARSYHWQDTWMKKPNIPDVKADIWSGSANSRGPLYSLSCNSPANHGNATSYALRLPSKLDALRKQMASAPAARPGPGNLHSFCYDYLYKKEGSYKPPKLDEEALRLIDKRLEAADTLGPCYYGQGIRRERSRVRSLGSADLESSGKEDASSTKTAHNRRRASCYGNSSTTALGGRNSGTTPAHSRDHDSLEDFHPRNYRLRSDIDIRRRKQASAPAGKSVQAMEFFNSPCDCQVRDMSNRVPAKRTVNFKELKDNLRWRYEGVKTDPGNSHNLSRKVDSIDDFSNSAHQSSCSHKCETTSPSSPSKVNHEHAAAAAANKAKHSNNKTQGPAMTAAATPNSAAAFSKFTRTASKKFRNYASNRHLSNYHNHLHRPHSRPNTSLCSEAAVEEPPQVRNERLDKSLQRQKMMLRLLRETRKRTGKPTSIQRPSRRLTKIAPILKVFG